MKCEAYQSRIEEYLDGELAGDEAVEIQQHLLDCVNCAGVVQRYEAEQEVYAAYAPEVNVSPQLWANIQTRIGDDVKPPAWDAPTFWSKVKAGLTLPPISGWATAALVLLGIVSTIAVMRYMQSRTTTATPIAAVTQQRKEQPASAMIKAPAPAVSPDVSPTRLNLTYQKEPRLARMYVSDKHLEKTLGTKTPTQLVHEAELKYIAAIQMLSRDAMRKRSHIDSATLVKLDQAISSIDRTIAGTRRIARQHPDDPIAVQYMLTAYARKVDVLREMSSQ